jgi:hypothetical protein
METGCPEHRDRYSPQAGGGPHQLRLPHLDAGVDPGLHGSRRRTTSARGSSRERGGSRRRRRRAGRPHSSPRGSARSPDRVLHGAEDDGKSRPCPAPEPSARKRTAALDRSIRPSRERDGLRGCPRIRPPPLPPRVGGRDADHRAVNDVPQPHLSTPRGPRPRRPRRSRRPSGRARRSCGHPAVYNLCGILVAGAQHGIYPCFPPSCLSLAASPAGASSRSLLARSFPRGRGALQASGGLERAQG